MTATKRDIDGVEGPDGDEDETEVDVEVGSAKTCR